VVHKDVCDLHVVHCWRKILHVASLRHILRDLEYVLESNLAPSDLALSALNRDTILCPVANSANKKWLLMVIFDTGVSLVITPNLSDFVLPSKPLSRPMRLGGMVNGIEIAGIGIVAWNFTVKDGTEVKIRTESYCMYQTQNSGFSHINVCLTRKDVSLVITVGVKTSLNSC
jgi:hypothetical protein